MATDDNLQAVGAAVRSMREMRGETVVDIAARVQMSPTTWHKIERGESVRPSTYAAVDRAFGLNSGDTLQAAKSTEALDHWFSSARHPSRTGRIAHDKDVKEDSGNTDNSTEKIVPRVRIDETGPEFDDDGFVDYQINELLEQLHQAIPYFSIPQLMQVQSTVNTAIVLHAANAASRVAILKHELDAAREGRDLAAYEMMQAKVSIEWLREKLDKNPENPESYVAISEAEESYVKACSHVDMVTRRVDEVSGRLAVAEHERMYFSDLFESAHKFQPWPKAKFTRIENKEDLRSDGSDN